MSKRGESPATSGAETGTGAKTSLDNRSSPPITSNTTDSANHPNRSVGGYLQTLTLALVAGAASLPKADRDRHANFLKSLQQSDGGFGGREGPSDPYYTAFGLRGLMVLGEIDEVIANKATEFLRSQLQTSQGIVDTMSIIFAAAILELVSGTPVMPDDDGWRHRVAELLQSLRCDDGGFGKTPEGRAGSTYQTFLAALCHELIEIPIPNQETILSFLSGQRQADGGYLEIRVAKRSGVNPTAAAAGTLRCIGQLDSIDRRQTIEFLSDRQQHDGGFAANTRIPFSDLLSTFTALWTIGDLSRDDSQLIQQPPPVDVPKAVRYANSMSRESGGFVGFELDDVTDVEYTFYGLAVVSLGQLS